MTLDERGKYMAKTVKSVSFSNAMIHLGEDSIVEDDKGNILKYSLSELLEEWNGIDGISITLKKNGYVLPREDDDEVETDGYEE